MRQAGRAAWPVDLNLLVALGHHCCCITPLYQPLLLRAIWCNNRRCSQKPAGQCRASLIAPHHADAVIHDVARSLLLLHHHTLLLTTWCNA